MAARVSAPFTLSAALLAAAACPREAAADSTLTLQGTVSVGPPDAVYIDFEVPAGTAEIQIDHDDQSDFDILDWGLYSPSGFRGWGGGNSEPIIVSEGAASRSYLTGPIEPGTWRLLIGKAKLDDDGGTYLATVTLRDVATLAPQPEREPYMDPGALESGPRWYSGDFHVHSRESGDARPPIDEIVEFARDRGLDFVELSDHNTTSQLDFMVDAQSRAGGLLLLPGVEYTTYAGHANGIGATAFVDHKIGLPGVTIDGAVDAFHDAGALFAINHPTLDLGEVCIGCAWDHELDPSKIDAVEIATAASAVLFMDATLAYWEGLSAQGHRIAAIGGSDDHKAGVDLGAFGSPIGSPTTIVFAEELSVSGILEGIRQGRTVVKVRGPDDPMIELSKRPGGPLGVVVSALVTGGNGLQARWVTNGENGEYLPIDGDSVTFELDVSEPEGQPSRHRLEIWEGSTAVTFTSHLWVEPGEGVIEAGNVEVAGGGCALSAVRQPRRALGGLSLVALAAVSYLIGRRRRPGNKSEE